MPPLLGCNRAGSLLVRFQGREKTVLTRQDVQPQGLPRLPWLSAPALTGAARLLRWWGKVGMSSGSQAGEKGRGSEFQGRLRVPQASTAQWSHLRKGFSLK